MLIPTFGYSKVDKNNNEILVFPHWFGKNVKD